MKEALVLWKGCQSDATRMVQQEWWIFLKEIAVQAHF
jgi:hypothetical protein